MFKLLSFYLHFIYLIIFFSLLNLLVVALAIRPDGKEVAVATLDGQLTFWHISTAMQLHCIEGQNDLGAGRKYGDRMTAKTSSMSKYG